MTHSAPVIVCGAGAAGMAAAIASARSGVETLLVEKKPESGGTVAHSLIHTLGGLYDSDGELINDGLPAELERRLLESDLKVTKRQMGRLFVLNVAAETYQRVTRDWLASEPLIKFLPKSVLTVISGGNGVVESVKVGQETFIPRAIIDATGNGSVAEQIEPESLEEKNGAAGGLVIILRGLPEGTLEFPKGIGFVRELRSAAARGDLPASCEHAWLDSGTRPDEVYLKLFVPVPEADEAMQTGLKAVNFLRTLPEFKNAELAETGEIGIRDGGRIKGEYELTAADVRTGRSFPDGVCRCAWPIEYWHPREGIQLESLPPGMSYEIPLRALRMKGWKNVFVAGKCLSADHLAQASARVVGTCWAMGEAVGKKAAEQL